MQLRQPVDGGRDGVTVGSRRQPRAAGQQGRGRVLEAVPGRIVGRVGQSEVGAQVDDQQSLLEQGRRHGRRLAVGEGQEDRVERSRVGQLGVDPVAGLGEVGERIADRQAIAVAGREPDDPDAWVPLQDADQLRTDVARGAEDGDPQAGVGCGVSRQRRSLRQGCGAGGLLSASGGCACMHEHTGEMNNHARSTFGLERLLVVTAGGVGVFTWGTAGHARHHRPHAARIHCHHRGRRRDDENDGQRQGDQLPRLRAFPACRHARPTPASSSIPSIGHPRKELQATR